MVAGVVGVDCKALVAPCQRRRSLRETKGKRFQNRNGTPFSGSVVAKMLKVNDAQLREAAAMKRAPEAQG